MADHAAVDPTYRASAQALTTVWKARLAKGQAIPGLSGTAGQQLLALSRLQTHLSAGTPASDAQFVPGPASRAPKATAAVHPNLNGHSPNSFAVRGAPGSGRSYWTGMQTIIAGHYCNQAGCEGDTDRFTSTITVNPGAVTTRVNGSNLYFPNSGNFENKHFELWAINHSKIVGDSDTGNLPSASVDYVTSNPHLNGTVLTSAVTLWVYIVPFAGYYADGAKTADATCHTKDNGCTY